MDAYLGEAVLRSALLLCVPILLAALGELVIERSGTLNLAIEGMVSISAATTFVVAFTSGSFVLAVICGIGIVVAIGLLFGHMTIDRRLDQTTVGLALLVLGLGGGSLIYRLSIGVDPRPARVETIAPVRSFMEDVPLVGPILFRQPWPVWVALCSVVPVWWILNRTSIGLRLRATGENPKSMDSIGVPVRAIRYGAIAAGAVLIGLAGACYPLLLAGGWSEGTVGGRGWLALMVVILSRWRVELLLPAAFLFAYLDAISFSLAIDTDAIPSQLIQMTPYLVAIIVIATSYGRSSAPRSLAKAYDREARF